VGFEGGAEDQLGLDALEMSVGGERDPRGLIAACPGGEAGDVDQRVEAAWDIARRHLEAQRDQLGPVAAGRDIVGSFILGAGTANDERAIRAVRLLLEHIGGEVQLGRQEIVHATVGGQLEGIVHLTAPAEEERMHDGVVFDDSPVVIVAKVESALPPADGALAVRLDRHEPCLPYYAARLGVH